MVNRKRAYLRIIVRKDTDMEQKYERLTRAGVTMSAVSAAVATWLTVKPRTRGLTVNMLGYGVKIIGGALSPVIAVMGFLGAVVSRRAGKDVFAFLGGLGALLATRYVHRVSADHDREQLSEAAPAYATPVLRHRWHLGQVTQQPEPRFVRDVVYATVPGERDGQMRELLCDLWVPSGAVKQSGLGVIYVHGGAWQSFDKDVATRAFFRHLTAQGHVAVDVAYRLAHETDMAGMVGDVKRAIAWLKANAHYLGVDPGGIVISGGSAGGHLALVAAYTPNNADFDPPETHVADTSVRGVFAYYPVADLRTLTDFWSQQAMHPLMHAVGRSMGYFTKEGYLRWNELVQRLFGGSPEEVGDLLLAYSPVAHVSKHCPPTLILQGQHDHVVPVGDVRALARSLVDAGCDAEIVEFPQVEHAFDLFARQVSPPAQSALYDVDRFLARLVPGS